MFLLVVAVFLRHIEVGKNVGDAVQHRIPDNIFCQFCGAFLRHFLVFRYGGLCKTGCVLLRLFQCFGLKFRRQLTEILVLNKG